jgi:hypothetical protein
VITPAKGGGQGSASSGDRAIERAHIGGLGQILGLVLIVLLFRDHAAAREILPARGGDLRQRFVGLALFEGRGGALQVGLRLLNGGLGLSHLLVQIGRFDFSQELSGRDAVSDVGVAGLHVAFGARQKGRFGNGLDVARQHQRSAGLGARGDAEADFGKLLVACVGLGHKLKLAALSRDVAEEEGSHNRHDGHEH